MAKNHRLVSTFSQWIKQGKNDFKDGLNIYPKGKLLVFFWLTLIFILGICNLWLFLFQPDILNLDLQIKSGLIGIRSPAGDSIFQIISIFGSFTFLVFLNLLLMIPLVIRHRKKAAVIFLITLLTTIVMVLVLKYIFGRERPYGCFDGRDCYSYPSGHTTLAVYFYGISAFLLNYFFKIEKKGRIILFTVITLFVMLIAFSRLYLGYHFLTDVIAGFLLGGIFCLSAVILIDLFYRKYR